MSRAFALASALFVLTFLLWLWTESGWLLLSWVSFAIVATLEWKLPT